MYLLLSGEEINYISMPSILLSGGGKDGDRN